MLLATKPKAMKPESGSAILLHAANVAATFQDDEKRSIRVLRGISLDIRRNEIVAILDKLRAVAGVIELVELPATHTFKIDASMNMKPGEAEE